LRRASSENASQDLNLWHARNSNCQTNRVTDHGHGTRRRSLGVRHVPQPAPLAPRGRPITSQGRAALRVNHVVLLSAAPSRRTFPPPAPAPATCGRPRILPRGVTPRCHRSKMGAPPELSVHKANADDPLWVDRVTCPACERRLKVLTISAHQGSCKQRHRFTAGQRDAIAALYRNAMKLYMRTRQRKNRAARGPSGAIDKENMNVRARPASRGARKSDARHRPSVLALLERTKKGVRALSSGAESDLPTSRSSSASKASAIAARVPLRESWPDANQLLNMAPSRVASAVRRHARNSSVAANISLPAWAARVSCDVGQSSTIPSIFRRRRLGARIPPRAEGDEQLCGSPRALH
jgi:hypothetical protein